MRAADSAETPVGGAADDAASVHDKAGYGRSDSDIIILALAHEESPNGPATLAAQYNHTLDKDGRHAEAYLRPPYSPWRLEVAPRRGAARDCFLHLLRVGCEDARVPGRAERVAEGGRLGVRIVLGDRTVTLLFHASGSVGGRLRVVRGPVTLHDEDLPQRIIQ